MKNFEKHIDDIAELVSEWCLIRNRCDECPAYKRPCAYCKVGCREKFSEWALAEASDASSN